MATSIRLSETDEQLYKQYAKAHDMTVSDFLKSCADKKIEESYEKEIFGIITVQTKKVIGKSHVRMDQ